MNNANYVFIESEVTQIYTVVTGVLGVIRTDYEITQQNGTKIFDLPSTMSADTKYTYKNYMEVPDNTVSIKVFH